mgnify:FL=1
MDRQQLGDLGLDAVYDPVTSEEYLPHGRILPFGDDPAGLLWKGADAFDGVHDVHDEELRVVGGVLRDEPGDVFQILSRLRRPSHLNPGAIRFLTSS